MKVREQGHDLQLVGDRHNTCVLASSRCLDRYTQHCFSSHRETKLLVGGSILPCQISVRFNFLQVCPPHPAGWALRPKGMIPRNFWETDPYSDCKTLSSTMSYPGESEDNGQGLVPMVGCTGTVSCNHTARCIRDWQGAPSPSEATHAGLLCRW